MKIGFWSIAMIVILAACQPQAATATPTAATTPAAAAPTSTKSASTALPTVGLAVSPTPGPHTSSEDPNAPNLIVVRDQSIVNSSVTIDLVRAAQPGWLVIYLSRNKKPGHRLGYVVIQVGEIKQLVVPLDPNSGVTVTQDALAGKQLFVVLQAGSKAPGAPVEANGQSVLEPFLVLPGNP